MTDASRCRLYKLNYDWFKVNTWGWEISWVQWQRPEEGANASNEEEEVFRDRLRLIDLILMDRGEIGAAETFQKHSVVLKYTDK